MYKNIRKFLFKVDENIIYFLRRISIPAGRFALFTVFFWFGILKIIGTSPANPLVSSLLDKTMPFMTWDVFIILFAIYEMIIGISFLIPKMERISLALLIPHMIMTALPLFMLTSTTWQGFMTPTLEGQYIIKNLVIISLAIGISAHIHPLKSKN